MVHKLFYCFISLLFFQAAWSQTPNVFLLDAQHLADQKASYKKGNPEVVKEVNMVVNKAESILKEKPESVVNKNFMPPSGSKHDYMSMGPYWWPDPSKPDGLPYIRKDGQRNPEIRKITDHAFLSDLDNRCEFLSLAYYFTGDDKYAAKAEQLLKVWFLDPDTRMNPNLNYAQAIPGINNGRGIGIIETRSLANLADWMGLLEGSPAFTNKDLGSIKEWYKEYLQWMQTSKNGLDEHKAKNNHGTHYDTQAATFALFTGNKGLAKQIITESRKRIAVQIEPDGEQKLELARTRAYSYSTMNLGGWFNLAMLGDKVGADLWNYRTSDGRSIHQALDWLIPYALEEKTRDHKQITPYNKDELYRLLLLASKKYNNRRYAGIAGSMPKNKDIYLANLLYN